MSKTQPHVIFIMTDQHARYASGAYGSEMVRTPHLNALADHGTVFDAAYCSSPMCVPSRASIMTGRPAHEIGAWDNAHPYAGEPESWAHALGRAGVHSAVIGKMHFRSSDDDTGFTETILPLDVSGRVGDVYSLIRDDMPARPALADLVRQAGVGESPYLPFDRSVADAACQWLDTAAQDEPWALTVSFATPHHPLLVPREYWDLYPDVSLPPEWDGPESQHPYPAELRRIMGVDSPFTAEEVLRARRAYFALCTLADSLVGLVLEHAGQRGFDSSNTVIIYTSDHGASLGERGLWWKHHLYEESVGVPLIVAGPGFEAGRRESQPVSLTSVYATILDALGVSMPVDAPRRTAALGTGVAERAGGFAEYHGLGASSAAYMVRSGRFKLIHFATLDAQLFDLENDPNELVNLAADPEHASVLAELKAQLLTLVDPDEVDARARAAQGVLIQKFGGRDKILGDGFSIPFTPPQPT
ncbi:MAG: sulfatase-like hydrolase/transferase [Rhodoglobus sp.]